MKKKNLSFLLVLVVLFSTLTFNITYAHSNDIKIKINTKYIYPDVAPFITKEGITYVHARFIAKKLGLTPKFSKSSNDAGLIYVLNLINKEKKLTLK